jgi:SAM-dependent methyltransferase
MAPTLYQRDLARIHHAGFGDFARNAGPGVLAALREAGITAGRVIDLGCGSGIWLRQLQRAGYEVIGVEPSREMVRLARATAPGARLVCSSAYDVSFPACDAVTALGEVLSYTSSPSSHLSVLRRLFGDVARALRPGGLFVFDLMVSQQRGPTRYRTWRAGDDWMVAVAVTEDRARHRLTREITTFTRAGAGYRRTDERHLLRVDPSPRIAAALREAGLRVRMARQYGQVPLSPGRQAFFARKAR